MLRRRSAAAESPSRNAFQSVGPSSAARATPYAPATPSAGAPRKRIETMASQRSSKLVQSTRTSSSGKRVWSISLTVVPLREIVRMDSGYKVINEIVG